jgi:hydroxyacylglutathione hydrolase
VRVVSIPCLRDNYAYLVICESTNRAAALDPSEAAPVLEAVESEGVELVAIWNTHHHWDHTGGNAGLAAAIDGLEVVGHVSDEGRIPGQTARVDHGDTVSLGDSITASIIHNPGHTSGAISYHVADPGVVFTGDTLFAGGCGRVFEGTPEQMTASLDKLAALPPQTRVYCGHEYTASNLQFAAAVEPDNQLLAERRREVDRVRAAGKPTVPYTIEIDLATNPFLRVREPAVIAAARARGAAGDQPAEVFAAIRAWKNTF